MARGLCGNNFAVAEDDSAQNIPKTVAYVQSYLGETRKQVDISFRSLIEYQEGAESSHLGHLMDMMDMMFVRPDRLPGMYQSTREKFFKSFEGGLISSISAASRCYMKCEQRPDAAELCQKEAGKGHEKTQLSRYCPPDAPYVRCQGSCWTKQEKLNKEKYIYELPDAWAKYNISAKQLLASSWNHFQIHGANGSLISQPIIDDYQIEETDDMIHLPVCRSQVKTIEDIGHKKRRRKFPFSCGGHRSEDSPAFIQSINVHLDHEPDMIRTNLAEHLKLVPQPFNSFVLLCQVNVRWPWNLHSGKPTNTSSHPDIIGGLKAGSRDPRCDAVMAETEGMDEATANTYFCKMPIVRKGVFRDERLQLPNAGGPENSKHKCKKWMRKHNSVEAGSLEHQEEN